MLNSFEELCIIRAAAVNSFARELNPHRGAYILSSTDRLLRCITTLRGEINICTYGNFKSLSFKHSLNNIFIYTYSIRIYSPDRCIETIIFTEINAIYSFFMSEKSNRTVQHCSNIFLDCSNIAINTHSLLECSNNVTNNYS